MMNLQLPSQGRLPGAAAPFDDICRGPGRLLAGDDDRRTWSWSMSSCERVREGEWRTNIW